jgi:hypothetical protein
VDLMTVPQRPYSRAQRRRGFPFTVAGKYLNQAAPRFIFSPGAGKRFLFQLTFDTEIINATGSNISV